MKKILIILLAITLLSGCGKTKEPDPELLDCVKSAVLNYLNENGYDEDDSYEISAVYTSKGDEFPRIYDMTVNDKAVCGIMCYYYDEAGYGGINYPYKNGYVSFIVHPDVLKMKEDWDKEKMSVNVNEWFIHEDGVVLDDSGYVMSQKEMRDLKETLNNVEMLNMLAESENAVKAGDQIGVWGPIMRDNVRYKSDNMLHVFQWYNCYFIITVNGEPMFSSTFGPDGMGTAALHPEFEASIINAFKSGKPFLILQPDTIITAETEYDDTLLPMLSRKVMKAEIGKVRRMRPYKCAMEFELTAE